MTDNPEAPRSTEQIAKALECSVPTVRRWCVSGRLTARKIGNQWQVFTTDDELGELEDLKPGPVAREVQL